MSSSELTSSANHGVVALEMCYGKTIVGRLVRETDAHVTLSSPAYFNLGIAVEGSPIRADMITLLSEKEELSVSKSFIVIRYRVKDEVARLYEASVQYYLKAFEPLSRQILDKSTEAYKRALKLHDIEHNRGGIPPILYPGPQSIN